MGPDVWGPHAWKFLHYVSLGYPSNPTPEQKQKYKQFFELLRDVLPCSLCANHYAENYKNHPLTDEILSDREKLIKWVIDVHNIVNEMKNKPVIRYVDARKLIDTDTKCKPVEKFVEVEDEDWCDKYLKKLMGLMGVLIFIALIYKKR
jgi:hypothetical protein